MASASGETRWMDENQARIEQIGDQLRAKISSKFQTSTFLAGFALAVLSIQISTLWQAERVPGLLPASIALTMASIVLYVFAVVNLDALTMPKLFWPLHAGYHKPQRGGYLSFEDLVELRKQMRFYWSAFTLVATLLAVVSLLLMLASVTHISFADIPREKKLETMNELVGTTTNYVFATMVVALAYGVGSTWAARKWFFSPLVNPGGD